MPEPETLLDLVIATHAVELYARDGWCVKTISSHLGYKRQDDFRALMRRVFDASLSVVGRDADTQQTLARIGAWVVHQSQRIAERERGERESQ